MEGDTYADFMVDQMIEGEIRRAARFGELRRNSSGHIPRDESKRPPKVKCPHCERRVRGLEAHIRDKHTEALNTTKAGG